MELDFWPALLLPIVVVALHYTWRKRAARPSVLFPPLQHALSSLARFKRRDPSSILLLLRYAALALLALGLARPQSSSKETERRVNGIDIMLVLDVSGSMDIEDLSTQSRMAIAKDTMQQFVRGRQNDRIGFAMFSGEAVTLAPPTLDYGLVLASIEKAGTGILRDGTAIGDGLTIAVNRLKDSTAKSRIIILMTDGDNNIGRIDPTTAGELAKGYDIRVYTIAIGKEGRVKRPIRQKNVFGQVFTTYEWLDNALNPQLLKNIAEQTQARFYRVTDEDTLQAVFKEIDRLERSEVKTKERILKFELFDRPIKFAVLLLLLEQVLTHFWWRLPV